MAIIGKGLFCVADMVQSALDIAKPGFLRCFHKFINIGCEPALVIGIGDSKMDAEFQYAAVSSADFHL